MPERIEVLYVSFNRLRYTVESFEALIANTNWGLVDRLLIHDDSSTDGTCEYLQDARSRVPVPVEMRRGWGPGPVKAMLWALENMRAPWWAKVDNDFVVCPGWLDELAAVLDASGEVDILGLEPFLGDPTPPPLPGRGYRRAEHVGGKFLARRSAFQGRELTANGRFGFTAFQTRNEDLVKAWVEPDLPCFGLDQLPFEPWLSLTQEYLDAGWHRFWPAYAAESTGYWDWWVAADPARMTV